MTTKKQLKRKLRDMKIKATYDSMPDGSYRLQELAGMFKCSVSSVWYAIHGRQGKKAVKRAQVVAL